MNDYPYFLVVNLPLMALDTLAERLSAINDMYMTGYRAVYQQLMVYEGEPILVVSLERLPEGSRKPQQHQPINDAISHKPVATPPPFDTNAGLAVPFPTDVELNEVNR